MARSGLRLLLALCLVLAISGSDDGDATRVSRGVPCAAQIALAGFPAPCTPSRAAAEPMAICRSRWRGQAGCRAGCHPQAV